MDNKASIPLLIEAANETLLTVGHRRSDRLELAELYAAAGSLDTLIARTASICRVLADQARYLQDTTEFRHDEGGDPATTVSDAIILLRQAADNIEPLTATTGAALDLLSHLATVRTSK